ncbi:hypothetical protein ACS5PN_29145 [Roseateles sp. NT4]|uniref:hypothetical protein n=1 Tax=Roseateles sp. NT4 TaxID=3453715 RepID=UPI003EEEC126
MPTLITRHWLIGLAVAVLLAWAAVGIATGHLYFMPGRGVVHLSGVAAFLACGAVVLGAGALVGKLVKRVDASRVPRLLGWGCLALAVLAIGLKMLEALGHVSTPELHGLLSEASLRGLLGPSRLSAWAAARRPGVNAWLLASCVALIPAAVIFRLLGVNREFADRHPRLTMLFFLVFGLPFLAWLSIELLAWLPALGASEAAGQAFAAKVAFHLSALIVLGAVWCVVGLMMVILLLKTLGGEVRWSPH